ncbi:hypothetical protein GF377_00270 [candidate division GN15 bacterium]|nr:hypothetical protein [candidate division GN15 bacterium]
MVTIDSNTVMDDTEHGFYRKPKREQRQIKITIAFLALAINLILGALSFWMGLYPLPLFFIAITLSVLAPFYDVPSMKASGRLIYYSPLLVAEPEKDGVIKLHGGTLFDYVFVIDRRLNGKQRTNQVLIGYIDGILNLIENYQGRDLKSIRVRGTSYILNERTANRVGLRKVENSFIQSVILIYNYANLTIAYSISRAGLNFPRMREIRTFEATLADLQKNSSNLRSLRDRLAGSLCRYSQP